MTDFTNSRKALEEFDKGKPERDAAWLRIDTNEGVHACEAADKAASDLVCEAFYLDTQAFNSKDNCMLMSVQDIRRIVNGTSK
jgi:hypothetical protein